MKSESIYETLLAIRLLIEFFRGDFILLSTRSLVAEIFQKVTELRINESFLTTEGLVVKNELDS